MEIKFRFRHPGLLYMVDNQYFCVCSSCYTSYSPTKISPSVSRVGIQSNRDDPHNMVFEPVLVHRQGQSPVVNRNGNNSNTVVGAEPQVESN